MLQEKNNDSRRAPPVITASCSSIVHTFDLQSFAQLMSARMLNCTAAGIGIALLAWVLLRGLDRQNSGTRFAVWFSALLGIAVLPLVGHIGSGATTDVAKPSGIIMPASWALYIFAAWAVVATAGLVRITVGFWRLRQLRKSLRPSRSQRLSMVLSCKRLWRSSIIQAGRLRCAHLKACAYRPPLDS